MYIYLVLSITYIFFIKIIDECEVNYYKIYKKIQNKKN